MAHTARHVWPDAVNSSWRRRRDACVCSELTTGRADRTQLKSLKESASEDHRELMQVSKGWNTQ